MSAYNTIVHVGYSLFRKCLKSGWKIDTRTLTVTEVNYSSRRKIETLLAYINKNLHEKLTIQALAKMIDQSPDYLAAQFKSITGFTIIQYINKCRIDQAKIMLLNDGMRIKDVAVKVGFCDEFYFSKTFKKYEGISPVHFIKNMR